MGELRGIQSCGLCRDGLSLDALRLVWRGWGHTSTYGDMTYLFPNMSLCQKTVTINCSSSRVVNVVSPVASEGPEEELGDWLAAAR